MVIISEEQYNSLAHYNVKGSKWYKHKFGKYQKHAKYAMGKIYSEDLGIKNLKNAKTANLEKWGKSPETNVLYIAGYSGSGKSTTTISLARPGDTKIHLDAYSEPEDEESRDIQDKSFNKYLDKHIPDWRKMQSATETGENGNIKRYSKEYWDIVDSFSKAIESYGAQQFNQDHRVIVEGVQIADNWLSESPSYYSEKPTIILRTNPITSMRRAFNRDDRGGILSGLRSLDSAKEHIQWYVSTNKNLYSLSQATDAKKRGNLGKRVFKKEGGGLT